ncbi:MAG: aminodeoxychorismate synthase component I, partial [Acidobacteria bacterium]|nr:aminodeoxychorismate synthase component I [Acidobacteriota bacterium]MCU0253663.1 aminodeoxychorismate synthase component I [Acidobacteriota bacterium]
MSRGVPAEAVFHFEDAAGRIVPRRFVDPLAVLEARTPGEVPALLEQAERAAVAGRWAAGFVAYEAASAFDGALVTRAPGPLPLAWFALFDAARVDAPAPPEPLAPEAAGRAEEFDPDTGETAWTDAVAAVRAAIARGETYQVNLTLRLHAPLRGEAAPLWRRLAARQRGGFAAFLELGRFAILSASPELFFRREGDLVAVRPMKGTAPRGRFPDEDDARAAALAASEKDRAENVMIVDLMRSDLGRVAVPGSVAVTSLCAVERYPTVLQMTSSVVATLRPGTGLVELFRALFPSGSVTGAPKASTMRTIAELERAPRGVYCGAIGLIAPGGDATFSVPIRTAVVDRLAERIEYGAGAGITWGSDPRAEHREVRLKAAVLGPPPPRFELLETLRVERGEALRLAAHVGRLAASARFFGWPFDAGAADAAVRRRVEELEPGSWRLRLVLAEDGALRVEAVPLEPLPEEPLVVALCPRPVSRDDPFLHHKTTCRAVYETRRVEHPGAHDVLLLNESGELTEFTRGNLVLELDGGRFTPPRECGLLGGVLRAELLARGALAERVLRPVDLARARSVRLISSLRGEVRVHFAAP